MKVVGIPNKTMNSLNMIPRQENLSIPGKIFEKQIPIIILSTITERMNHLMGARYFSRLKCFMDYTTVALVLD